MRSAIFVILLLCVAAMVGVAAVFAGRAETLDFAPQLDEKALTVAYACGYRAGQVGIMSRMSSTFRPSTLIQTEDCTAYRSMAIRNGFSTVRSDPEPVTETKKGPPE